MSMLTLNAHFDGSQVRFDEPIELPPNTKLLVTVLSTEDTDETAWLTLSAQGLAKSYGDNEPEYSLTSIKETNPKYERG